MKRPLLPVALALAAGVSTLLAPATASADHHGGYGGFGPHYYVGVHYYGGPGFYYHGGYGYYYPPAYYYGPGFYYPPPAVVYQPEPDVVYETTPSTQVQPPTAFWYYCPPAKAYFPYVRECPSGWQAMPAPPQPASEKEKLSPAPAPAGPVTYRLGEVLFATAQSQLQAEAASTLDSLLNSINKEPNRHIVIEGHTDDAGQSAENLRLSQARAEAVKQYLIDHGVPPDRVTAVGKGEAGPIASNATVEGRQQNRRVDIIVN